LRDWFRGFVLKYMRKPLAPNAIKELGPLSGCSSVMKDSDS